MNELTGKSEKLAAILRQYGRVAIAYSGGVDSTFLAAFAQEVLPPSDLLLINALSPSFPEDEARFVQEFASSRKIRLLTVETKELENDAYADNPPSRCYFCKTEMYTRLWPIARREGMDQLADGFNADDLQDYRPGQKAAHEQEVRHPLQEAGFTKDDIRQLSREMALPTWDKPAYACLASRFPYGERITEKKLRRVEEAERLLKQHGFRIYRVRSHGQLARLEVGEDEMGRAFEMRETLSRALKRIGFAFVTIDLTGFRSGSMNVLVTSQAED